MCNANTRQNMLAWYPCQNSVSKFLLNKSHRMNIWNILFHFKVMAWKLWYWNEKVLKKKIHIEKEISASHSPRRACPIPPWGCLITPTEARLPHPPLRLSQWALSCLPPGRRAVCSSANSPVAVRQGVW